MNEVVMSGVTMTTTAATSVEETGMDVAADVARIQRGEITGEQLLAECLDGAEGEERESAMRDYVNAVIAHVERSKAS